MVRVMDLTALIVFLLARVMWFAGSRLNMSRPRGWLGLSLEQASWRGAPKPICIKFILWDSLQSKAK